uniref:Uncharacterized protein n=1 Tax=Chrysemys picta bellii TaxID=8478 RepID=A0A8C3IM02_CHRPI
MLGIRACGRITALVLVPQEPKIPLPEKFDGDCGPLSPLIPHVQDRVGLIFSLLTGEALTWMSPLLEQFSSLLSQLEEPGWPGGQEDDRFQP